ncbi:MAG: hypothetical protein L0J58_08665, partial [Micrococcaceae bacterium]|nr:hypothetical protein [Micrococcaceae bacterium]
TTMRLTGSVDLLKRELDQRLGVTLPISQSLPIAAIAAGAPVVGGALGPGAGGRPGRAAPRDP